MSRYFAVFIALAAAAAADLTGVFRGGLDHPAIQYNGRSAKDPAAELNRSLREGKLKLRFDPRHGYLPAVLEALRVPVESQMLVFSKTSVQAGLIHPLNPRALYFNDSVVIGYVPGAPMLEIASQDPEGGTIFYTVHQDEMHAPEFDRQNSCLGCHESLSSIGVPGLLMRSVYPAADGRPVRPKGEYRTDHRSRMEERWGGWYVTGKSTGPGHLGNTLFLNAGPAQAFLSPDAAAQYLTPYSDVVALSVFGHQVHMSNLLTRAGWEARLDPGPTAIGELAREVVDYLLFADEPPLEARIAGDSGFAAKFASLGPLRQFDLERRMMRYPCSYMIYSPAFGALPADLKAAIYKRLNQVLTGEEKSAKYARLTLPDRRVVVKILRETKSDLPRSFGAGLE